MNKLSEEDKKFIENYIKYFERSLISCNSTVKTIDFLLDYKKEKEEDKNDKTSI